MKKILPLLLMLAVTHQIISQIYVQTVGYWDLNETYSFDGSYQKYKVSGPDTTYQVNMTYEIDVKIIDSTENSYTIQWLYKNHQVIGGDKFADLLSPGNDTVVVKFLTDELGAFQEILNMDELLNFYKDLSDDAIKNAGSDEQTLNTIKTTYTSLFTNPEYIKNNSVKDLMNFYFFHGGKYELNEEYTGELKSANNYGGEPFDTKTKVWLSEIDTENNNYVMRSYMEIDSIQLKEAAYTYLKSLADSNNEEFPPFEKMPKVTNETYVANRIHGSGWTTYSIITREVISEGVKNIEEYIIQIK